jgi:hypothetical protein
MRKYRVYLSQTVYYTLEVECEDDIYVIDAAKKAFSKRDYLGENDDPVVVDWKLIDD